MQAEGVQPMAPDDGAAALLDLGEPPGETCGGASSSTAGPVAPGAVADAEPAADRSPAEDVSFDLDELLSGMEGGASSSSAVAQGTLSVVWHVPKAPPLVFPGGDDDIPQIDEELPPEVVVERTVLGAKFHLRCQVDLQECTMKLRCGSLNLRGRRDKYMTVRVTDPVPLHAKVFAGGEVIMTPGKAEPEQIRAVGRRIARMILKCGYEHVKFGGFRFTVANFKANMGFPIRLEALARKWERHCIYVPEVTKQLVFKTAEPYCSLLVYSTGNVLICPAPERLPRGSTAEDFVTEAERAARAAVRKVRPLFQEFCV